MLLVYKFLALRLKPKVNATLKSQLYGSLPPASLNERHETTSFISYNLADFEP